MSKMIQVRKYLLFLLVVAMISTSVFSESSEAANHDVEESHEYNVVLTNHLGDNFDLTAECQLNYSKNSTWYYLQVGQKAEWSFGLSSSGETLFSCSLTWGYLISGNLDLFDNKRDADRCNDTCFWSARQGGLYGSTTQDPDAKLFNYWTYPPV